MDGVDSLPALKREAFSVVTVRSGRIASELVA